jgi:shikimate kinase
MDSTRQIRNITLIGFMGTGKSSVGRLVAGQLRFRFVDTDAEIEARTGKTIAAIFAENGESTFRQLERELVLELGSRSHTVISAGGGLGANAANLASLKEHSLVICLWATPENIWERVRHQTHRPLLREPDPLAKIRHLLSAREPFYKQADVLINTDLRSLPEAAQQVAHQFHLTISAPR